MSLSEIILRSGLLILVCLATWLVVWAGRSYVENQRRHVLTADGTLPGMLIGPPISSQPSSVRILAFSSADCHQCHRLQTPALKKVMEAYANKVTVVEVDAPNEPELTGRYRVLTVPTTVVLDGAGHPHAVNYGFANTQKLLEQVDEVLAQSVL